MASKNLRKALAETLEDLSRDDLRRFCFQLCIKEPWIKTSDLRGRNPIAITDLLVSSFSEVDAVSVAVNILNTIGCKAEAETLVMKERGQFTLHPRGKNHFVDKYQIQLIAEVRNVKPILNELLTKGVIQQESYDKIMALPTSQEKIRELFVGLKAVGVGGKDILYNILEELEPHLIENIHQKNVLRGGSSNVGHLRNVTMEMRDDWIKVEPKVNREDGEDAPTYSLQTEAGNFECCVSGMRWVCKEKVSFKYRFGSWEEHTERLETMQYIPGGPLQDITVIDGKFDEVYLPHWICTDDNPTILSKFAVLHIDTCGDVVEQVSEVTPSHVKLSEPIFSPRGVLMKAGFPVKINCKVLIFKTNKAFLTLHVFLIPRDPALQQTIKELSSGYKMIEKPYPVKSLKMRNHFILTADKDSAEISPESLKLVYESSDPNFFEVFIDSPDSNFQLTLSHESGPVWTCVIRKDDYQNTGEIQVMYDHELARVRSTLVANMSVELINQLLDDLLEDGVLNDGEKDSILQENSTRADRVRCLIDMVKKKGCRATRQIVTHLQRRDPSLSAELGLAFGLPV
ncbi:NACHT, LRR and PYD domains-containing protein 1 homolog isoform X2 [Siniperca chuatsi]|uniref:NACHT, LRR and PYD domains-containing protein 1 homolog isoform X2 n=1 Tax=Siniperca chuatsi TaxID=119488 RepID=UPI001CE0D8B4|nr:NACHT, LRR and PYD domains-containing protein 1 homolog isoform X2 [Siniperca chuatsi]